MIHQEMMHWYVFMCVIWSTFPYYKYRMLNQQGPTPTWLMHVWYMYFQHVMCLWYQKAVIIVKWFGYEYIFCTKLKCIHEFWNILFIWIYSWKLLFLSGKLICPCFLLYICFLWFFLWFLYCVRNILKKSILVVFFNCF